MPSVAEIELKFPVSDSAALESKLPALGFILITPRTFEHNTLFDTADRSLRARRQILRLREYGDRCVLTHKRQPANVDDSHYKTRIETETTLGDCDAMREIIAQLGYVPVFTYEKFRTEWSAAADSDSDDTEPHLVIDETAIGTWAELEGTTAWIDRTLETLGIDPLTCLTDSYGTLFLKWKRNQDSDAQNLTFDEISRSRELASLRP